MRRLLLLFLAITQIGAAPAPLDPRASPRAPVVAPGEEPLQVPLLAIVADPERYDGKLVTVTGFLNLEFEGDAIYPSRPDFDAMFLDNAVWVDGPKFEEPAARRALSGHYVYLTGRFDADGHGHLGLFAGKFHASTILVHLSRDQIHASMFPLHRDLPWPLLIIILLPSSILLAAVLALRSRLTSAKPGLPLTAATLALAGAVGVFSAFRLYDPAWEIIPLIQGGYPWMLRHLLVEMTVGVMALLASAVFAFRRNLLLCAVFAAVQLIVPAILEIRDFQILDVPFSPRSAVYNHQLTRWVRAAPTVPPRLGS